MSVMGQKRTKWVLPNDVRYSPASRPRLTGGPAIHLSIEGACHVHQSRCCHHLRLAMACSSNACSGVHLRVAM